MSPPELRLCQAVHTIIFLKYPHVSEYFSFATVGHYLFLMAIEATLCQIQFSVNRQEHGQKHKHQTLMLIKMAISFFGLGTEFRSAFVAVYNANLFLNHTHNVSTFPTRIFYCNNYY